MTKLNIERVVLEKVLHKAAAASRLIGHLDDNVGGAIVGPIADSIDELVHTLSELLGDPRVIVASVPDGCSVFPDSLDDGHNGAAHGAGALAVEGSRPRVKQRELLGRSLGIRQQAVGVAPGTTLIALLVLAMVTAAVIGGAP